MKTNKIYDSYASLPSWSRGVIAVVGVGFIVFSSYLIYKGVNKIINPPPRTSDEESKDDLKNLSKSGIKATYSDTQYSTWAEQMHVAMKWNGTDEDAIYRVLNYMKNDADVLKLIEAYGKKPEIGTTFVTWFDTDLTLPEQIASDLNASEIVKCNNILATKGIKFRF